MQISFPIRINRYLALKGYCSRRQADKLIERGLVKINGQKAKIGDKANATDQIEVIAAVAERIARDRVYFAFHKPVGVATEDSAEKLKLTSGVFHVGRLDKNSSGLLLLTNDGRITDRLLNPDYEHEKEYVVAVDKRITNSALSRLARGVNIEGYQTRPATVERTGDNGFRIILTEGKPHQIRRMCAALSYAVRDLKRVRVMNLTLGNMRPGEYRKIEKQELNKFLASLGI